MHSNAHVLRSQQLVTKKCQTDLYMACLYLCSTKFLSKSQLPSQWPAKWLNTLQGQRRSQMHASATIATTVKQKTHIMTIHTTKVTTCQQIFKCCCQTASRYPLESTATAKMKKPSEVAMEATVETTPTKMAYRTKHDTKPVIHVGHWVILRVNATKTP